MSRANASKSGTGIWPGAYSSSALSDASLADIVCGGGGGGGGGGEEGGGGRELGDVAGWWSSYYLARPGFT